MGLSNNLWNLLQMYFNLIYCNFYSIIMVFTCDNKCSNITYSVFIHIFIANYAVYYS